MVSDRDQRRREVGSAAAVVALLLLVVVLALGVYVAWGLLSTPQLTALAPNPAAAKSNVTLSGARFATAPGGNIVLFGDEAGQVVRATPTELEVKVPDLGLPAGRQARVPVRVLVNGRVSEPVELTIGLPEPPAPSPTPSPEATPEPVPEASPAGSTPPAIPSRSPRPPRPSVANPTPAPVGRNLLSEADAAAAVRDFDHAARLYEQSLKEEPGNARAKAGLDAARASQAAMTHAFVLGKTQGEGGPARADMKAFDTRDVAVRRPPEVPARVEIEAVPAHIRPGDAITFRVFMQNDGDKALRLAASNVAATVDTVRSSEPATLLLREVPPHQRALVLEISERWKPVSHLFRLEVQISSERGETYSNVLSWK